MVAVAVDPAMPERDCTIHSMRTDGYVWDDHTRWIEKDGKIVGRLSGQAGSWWYQVAAKPHDEPAVMGFADAIEAFRFAVRDLERFKRK
jgi:hypothetical protein